MPLPLRSLAYRAAQKLMTLDVTSVIRLKRDGLVAPAADPAFTFRFLSPNDVRSLAADEAAELRAEMAERISGGRDFCFAALAGDRLASYAWFALGSIEAEHHRGRQPNSGLAISFPANMAFMYKGFTHPDYRGRKLYGAVVGLGLLGLGPHGVDTVVSTMEWTNTAARRGLGRIGFEELGLCFRWGWGNWMHTWPPREAVLREIHFDRQAEVQRRPDLPGLHRLQRSDQSSIM